MIALLEANRAGLWQPKNWLPNIIAGAVVGVVALPLAMAFAIASGAKPEQGLYTAIVAGMMVSLFGGSRVQIAGPTGAFIVILASITARYGIDGLQLATLMAGVMLLVLGIARLGSVIKFIPAPVIVGFTAGIAVVIWVGQWKEFFGLPVVHGMHFHEKLWELIKALPNFHATTLALALLSLLLLLFTSRVPGLRRVPAPLVAVLVATGLQAYFHFAGVATIGSEFGGIPRGLPVFHLPTISTARVIELLAPAFTIMMLGAIESLLSAVVADGMSGTRHDSNQELIGQGLANIAAPLFGGFAATGAIARTATNIRNGGNSPLAGVVHALTLILVILLLAPLAVHVPLAVLAAVLFVVAWNMSEVPRFIKMAKRAPVADVVILFVTFGLTVFADLVVAVNIGVILAILQFLRRMSASVDVQLQTEAELHRDLSLDFNAKLPEDILVFTVNGPIFFGGVETFQRSLSSAHEQVRTIIIRLNHVPFVDITAINMLEEQIVSLQKRNVRVVLTEPNERVAAKLRRARIVELMASENLCDTLSAGLRIATES